MKICHDVEEWITQKIIDKIKQQEKRCKKWPWPLSWACSIVTKIVEVVTTITTKIIRVICEIFTVILVAIAAIVAVLLAIPIIGFIIRVTRRWLIALICYFVGLMDGAGRAIGISIDKNLRVHIIPLSEGNIPLAYSQHLELIIAQTKNTFLHRAGIKVSFTVHDPLRNPPENALRIGTATELILDEAWLKGSWHQLQTLKLEDSNIWSLFGIGLPLIVFVIREVGYDGEGAVVGASGGPGFDWVVVEMGSVVPNVLLNGATPVSPIRAYPPTVVGGEAGLGNGPNPNYSRYVMAHELCHALGLLGHGNSTPLDLMWPRTLTGDALSPFQVGIIRSSPHVTYL